MVLTVTSEREIVFGEQLVPSTALVYSALILGKSFLQEEDWQEKLSRLLFLCEGYQTFLQTSASRNLIWKIILMC